MNHKKVDLHTSILPKNTKTALDFLSQQMWLKDSGWYLAGGTALALQAGHRKSYDLDFFTQAQGFKGDQFLLHFISIKEWETTTSEDNTVYGKLLETKVSFIAYPFFVPKQTYVPYGAINVIDALDIAVMKIIAISQRGRKRDFYDLFWCANHLESLEDTVCKLPAQYPKVAHNYHHILSSLVYFADAEEDPEPEIHFTATWNEIKNYFTTEVPKITHKVLKLT